MKSFIDERLRLRDNENAQVITTNDTTQYLVAE